MKSANNEFEALNQGIIKGQFTTDPSNPEKRTYAYLGNETGFLKVWDLTSALTYGPVKSYMELHPNYFASRMEEIDVSRGCEGKRHVAMRKKMPRGYNPYECGVHMREVKAH
jgi:hypothetical protein